MTKLAIVVCAVFFASAANATFFKLMANKVLDIKDQEIKIMQDKFVSLETYLNKMMGEPIIEILNRSTTNIALAYPTTEHKINLDNLIDMPVKLNAIIKSAGDIDISECMNLIEQENKPNVPVSEPSAIPRPSSCDLNEVRKGLSLLDIVGNIIRKAIIDLGQNRDAIAKCRITAMGAFTAGACSAGAVVKGVSTSSAAKTALIIPSTNLNSWWWNSGKTAVDSCKVNHSGAYNLSVAAPPVISSTPIDPYAPVTKCVQDKIAARQPSLR